MFDSARLAHEFKISPGDKFSFSKTRKRIERLQEFYASQDFLDARINLERQDRDDQVDLIVQIEAGPKVQMRVRRGEDPQIREQAGAQGMAGWSFPICRAWKMPGKSCSNISPNEAIYRRKSSSGSMSVCPARNA